MPRKRRKGIKRGYVKVEMPTEADEDEFKIIPLQGQKTYKFADTLPEHPCRMILVGASQLSGKSTVLFSLLSKKFPYFTFYGADNIYVICPTIYDDHRWRNFKLNVDNIRVEWDNKFIQEIEEKVSKNKKPSLLICDDIIPIQGTRRDNEPFHAVFTRGRHYGENRKSGGGLAIWVTTQYYKALDPVVRGNSSNLCLWLASDAEAVKIYEEHSNGLSKQEWMYIYKYAVVKAHSFLHINYSNSERTDGRFCMRFEKVLQIAGHEDEDLETKRIDEAKAKTDIDLKEHAGDTEKKPKSEIKEDKT